MFCMFDVLIDKFSEILIRTSKGEYFSNIFIHPPSPSSTPHPPPRTATFWWTSSPARSPSRRASAASCFTRSFGCASRPTMAPSGLQDQPIAQFDYDSFFRANTIKSQFPLQWGSIIFGRPHVGWLHVFFLWCFVIAVRSSRCCDDVRVSNVRDEIVMKWGKKML